MPHMLCLFAFYYVYYIHIFILLFFFSFLTHKCVHTCIDRRMRTKIEKKLGFMSIWFDFISFDCMLFENECVCVCLCVSSMKWCFGLLFDWNPETCLGYHPCTFLLFYFEAKKKRRNTSLQILIDWYYFPQVCFVASTNVSNIFLRQHT